MSAEAATLRDRDIRFHMHPQTNPVAHEQLGPIIIASGEGCYFIDQDGRRYLDMHAGLWCASLGFSEPRLKAAADRQFDRIAYMQTFAHRTTEPVIELSERLIKIAPPGLTKAMFQSSGSEAIDTAVKMVWYYWHARGKPQRRKIIARTKAYHGTTVTAASLTHLPHMHESFGLPLPGFIHVAHPDIYRGPQGGESDDAYSSRLAAELEATINQEGPETIAAFFAEPVMGAGGLYPPPATYFEKVQRVLRRHDILFVADEVICGFGRTGDSWGCERYNLRPDLLTCAKALSSAYLPISALLVGERVYDVIRSESDRVGVFGHGYTYGGHPVCAAVACETLRIYEEENLIPRAAERGRLLEQQLKSLADHPLVGNVRGVGLMWGVELVKDKDAKLAFDPKLKVGQEMSTICLNHGLNTRPLGGHTMAFTPPLIISEDEIIDGVKIFAKSLDELAASLRARNLIA